MQCEANTSMRFPIAALTLAAVIAPNAAPRAGGLAGPSSTRHMEAISLAIDAGQAGLTLAALLRRLRPDLSWSEVRRLIEIRRVTVGNDLCFDPARRLKEGERVEL